MSAQTLSGGWTATNIGNPALSGSASFNGSVFTVSAAGADIYGTSDQFVFTYRTLSGDGDIVGRVNSLGFTDAWAKAGLMMRASLAANAPHVAALVSAGNGSVMEYRTATGGVTTVTGRTSSTRVPVWFKVERRGSRVTTYRSTDGANWTQMAAVTISLPSTVYVGIAVTSHNVGARTTAQVSDVEVSGTAAIPAPWTASDIGSPAISGSSWAAGETWTSSAAGADIYGSYDQFRYVYQPYSGDVDVVVRLTSLGNTAGKAGVMIRGSLAANSANAAMLFYGQGGDVLFQHRSSNGGATTAVHGPDINQAVWLKLSKRGSTITGYLSLNGSTWTAAGSRTMTLPTTFYVGFANTSRQPSATASATFTNLSTGSTSTPAPTPTNQAPTVSMTAPASGSSFTAPATMTISASAADADGTIARVDFRAGSTLIGSDTTSPYAFSVSGVPAGTYSITAVATDNSGASTTSAPVTVTVAAPGTSNQAPLVSLTSPADGSLFSLLGLLTMTASASDPDGTIARVEFYAGSTLLGTDTSSPYAFTWLNLPLGTFSLMAVAYDNDGAMSSSAQRTISVGSSSSLSRAVWVPSADHGQVVTYVLDVFTPGANPETSNPVASRDLGRPAIINGECSVDISQFIESLPPGTYVATVSAIANGGTSRSALSPTFTR